MDSSKAVASASGASRDYAKALRIVAALAIVVYLYDIFSNIMAFVDPVAVAPGLAQYFTGEGAATGAALAVRIAVYASIAVTLAISVAEVRAGLGGLRGHVSKLEVRFCLIVAIMCACLLANFFVTGKDEYVKAIEYGVSGTVVFFYWFFGSKVLAASPHDVLNAADYAKGMKVIGAVLMGFSAWDIIGAIRSIFDPASLGIDAAAADAMSAPEAQQLVVMIAIIGIAIAGLSFYAGYIGFKERPTRPWATIGFGVAIAMTACIVGNIVMNGTIYLQDFSELSSAALGYLYWHYYRKMTVRQTSKK